ncbi:MAG: hypothetical protein M9894_17870 [Planctomycetes bacterium]|nr:hypothetical protein [Planctomycetota bacterium]
MTTPSLLARPAVARPAPAGRARRGPHPAGLGSLLTATYSVLLALLAGAGSSPRAAAGAVDPAGARRTDEAQLQAAPTLHADDPGLASAPAREAPSRESLSFAAPPRPTSLTTPAARPRAAAGRRRRPDRRRRRPISARAPPST